MYLYNYNVWKRKYKYLWRSLIPLIFYIFTTIGFFIVNRIINNSNRYKQTFFNKSIKKRQLTALIPLNKKVDICFTVISCDRLFLLKNTLKRFLRHVKKYEPNITYQLNWIDQASEGRQEILNQYHFHNRLFSYKRMGHPFSFTMGFHLCNADYIFLLEEDMYLNDPKMDFITKIINVLKQTNDSIFGVVMREIPHEWFQKSPKEKIPNMDGLKCLNMLNLPFHFVNSPGIYKMKIINYLLSKGSYEREDKFGQLAKRHNKTFIIIDDKRFYYNLFTHIGASSVSSDKGQICNNIVW